MELCAKETLAALLSPDNQTRRIDRIEALRIFYQVARGLTYIHEQRIVSDSNQTSIVTQKKDAFSV